MSNQKSKILENQSIPAAHDASTPNQTKAPSDLLTDQKQAPLLLHQAYCFERNAKQMGRLPWSSRSLGKNK
jgi:hypothetical protein